MSERRQYPNPPIKEAVCEFHFGPNQDWDPLLPGKLQQALGERYTGKAREARSVSIGLETHDDRPPNIKYREEAAKIQLVTGDGTRMAGVGKNVLSVHMLRPYQSPDEAERVGWDAFVPLITEALSAYWDVANPGGVKQIGIRYINEILIPEESVEVDDYIKDALPKVEGIPDTTSGFVCWVEYAYDDNVRLRLCQATLKTPPEHIGLLLDLDVVWKSDEAISQDDAVAKAMDLRDRERAAFEAFITDKSRDLFDAD